MVVMPGQVERRLHVVTVRCISDRRVARELRSRVLKVGEPVGTATITFASGDAATLTYSVRGASGVKSLQRQIFATPGTIAGNFAGLWWGGVTQNGWGFSIHQQGGTLFNVWYTYDAAGTAVWYVMPGGTWLNPRIFSGPLYRTRGSHGPDGVYPARSSWNSRHHDPRPRPREHGYIPT